MKMKKQRKSLSLILCIMLTVAMALFTSGCNDKTEENESSVSTEMQENTDSEAADEEAAESDAVVLGEGETKFFLTVADGEGTESSFEIHTDKETVGEALLELDLISGEEGEFGLYVKSVNGIVADYDIDGTYWAFYINGEYAMTGVDATAIEEGAAYMLKVEK